MQICVLGASVSSSSVKTVPEIQPVVPANRPTLNSSTLPLPKRRPVTTSSVASKKPIRKDSYDALTSSPVNEKGNIAIVSLSK